MRLGDIFAARAVLYSIQSRLLTSSDHALYEMLDARIAKELPRASVPKSKLYVDAQHGLGNRVRALASGAAIAQVMGREFVVVWEPDHHCNCLFEDLFDYNGPVISKSFLQKAYETMDVTNYMEIEEGSDKDGPVVLTPGKDAYLRSAYYFNSECANCEFEREFFHSLHPSSPVKELLEGIDVSGCIGVHIRMEGGQGLDHNTYDSAENWPEEDHALIQEWRGRSHYSRFLDRVDKLLSENPALRVFLAADMAETYDVFIERYGEKLIYLRRDLFDRSKSQLIYALADAILLSRVPILLGSPWSSFSELAMKLAHVPQIVEFSGRDF